MLLSLLRQPAQEQARVDQLGLPHQPGVKTPWLLHPKPGTAVSQPAQLSPPPTTAHTIVGELAASLQAPGAPWEGLNLEEGTMKHSKEQ